MNPLRVEVTRGSLVESVHQVSAAVVTADDELVAAAGNPDLITFWRSAAKPFQAMPLIEDGVAERFGLTDDELALACASHSSEPFHLEGVDRFLAKVGVEERDLACGPHPPLSAEVARAVTRDGIVMTPRWSNCSGKHTGMLATAKHHGWPLAGYERAGHPLQDRLLDSAAHWSGLGRDQIVLGVDGCTTVCYGMPLRAMALAYARFAVAEEDAPRRLYRAMTEHPELVAGTNRLCTDLMRAWEGAIVAKVGAEGVYSAAVPSLRLGIAIKVMDGDLRSVGIALIAVLRQILERSPRYDAAEEARLASLAGHAEPVVRHTRGGVVGALRGAGELQFFRT